MAQSSYPFDGQTTTETQFSQFFRELQDTGVAASADSLGLKVTADAGGMRVFLGTGSAIVRGFFYNNDVSLQLTIAAAHATLARVDRVVLRLDPGANSIVAAVITGTPGSGVPAVTQTTTGVYELPLAQVNVAASSTSVASGNVTDERTFIGNGVTSWTTATRPAGPRKGRIGYNSTTNSWEFWDGSAWVSLLNYNSLTNVPSSFPPSTHTHTWGDVTLRPSTFPPSAHSHTGPRVLSGLTGVTVSSGSVTGTQDVTFADQGSAPHVVACGYATQAWVASISNLTSTGFRITVRQIDNTAPGSTTTPMVSWIAIVDDVAGQIV